MHAPRDTADAPYAPFAGVVTEVLPFSEPGVLFSAANAACYGVWWYRFD
jgi:hypothetical protein